MAVKKKKRNFSKSTLTISLKQISDSNSSGKSQGKKYCG